MERTEVILKPCKFEHVLLTYNEHPTARSPLSNATLGSAPPGNAFLSCFRALDYLVAMAPWVRQLTDVICQLDVHPCMAPWARRGSFAQLVVGVG